MFKFLNCTPHDLHIVRVDGVTSTIDKSGIVPRLAVERKALGELGYFAVVQSTMGAPEGLPEYDEDTILIVSALVAEHPALAGRTDLAYPGEAVRDDAGRVVGARGLCAGPGLAARLAQ